MAMLCPKCEKESNNLRVCPFCQTPYPTDVSARGGTPRFTRATATPRSSRATSARDVATDPRVAMAEAKRSRTIRWVVIGVLAAGTAVFYFVARDKPIPVGVALPNLIAASMSPIEAANLLRTVNGTAQVEERGGELVVRVSNGFPERRDGQLAFAQQYTRADEIVQGKKRAISFLDPGGKSFAKADPAKGVAMTR